MSSGFKRPLALWIAQVLLVCFGLIFLAPTFFGFLLLLTGDLGLVWGVQVLQRAFIGLPSAFGCFFSVWAISKRKSWGRWLGIVSILIVLAVTLSIELGSKLSSGNTRTSEVTIAYIYSL